MTDLNMEPVGDSTYILPNQIGHEDYQIAAKVLLSNPQAQIILYCAGDGGSVRDAFAIVDLIRAHGNVVGMLAGTACSCHSIIWASCSQRYVYPYAVLGIHKVGYGELGRGLDTKTALQLIDELGTHERYMAEIYASASNKSIQWWHKAIQEAGRDEYRLLTSAELVSMAMARPFGDFIAQATLEKSESLQI